MSPAQFIAKWSRVDLSERAAYQQHFLDLCELVGHAKPAEVDPTGESFCFERGARKHGGGNGWADVWKCGFFAFEYKGRHRDLDRAYDQLLLYRESLENPPLLAVCDTDRIIIRTNFTGTATAVHEVSLALLDQAASLALLRALFFEPEALRPQVTVRKVTEVAASRIGDIAFALRARGLDAHAVAQFLDRIVFCLFAEDVGLLPERVFSQIVGKSRFDPPRFKRLLDQLFAAMAHGGDFGTATIRHFNGDLFTDAPALDLHESELEAIHAAAQLDWSSVDPSVFGTLFERGLDPAKRAQLGAHYTSREDIEMLVDPVVIEPLRREWKAARTVIDNLLQTGTKSGRGNGKRHGPAEQRKALREADAIKDRLLDRLGAVRVLDPACGSGNFLYVTLQRLLDLEKEVMIYGGAEGLHTGHLPRVVPWHFHGIELNPYAYDLAQMTLWIGYLQWKNGNGYALLDSPLLRKMEGFQCRDAILDQTNPPQPCEPTWPEAEFIVGNPPFLGGKMMRRALGDDYVDQLFRQYAGRVPAESDLCTYWFERARAEVKNGRAKRIGLLATQGIRGGASRTVLKRILADGGIFFAVSDREWTLDGAAVHISMVGFDDGTETTRTLDGRAVPAIAANLTASAADLTEAHRLAENLGVAFMGDTKIGPFDIPESLALEMLGALNPHGRSNRDVVRPWANGLDVTRSPQRMWIIDFPPGMAEAEAMLFEQPYEHVRRDVLPLRANNNRALYREQWWIHGEARPGMRVALNGLPRFVATVRVAKHRLFVWLEHPTLPDSALFVFARADDYFLGVLHSRVHEVWSLAMGTQLREKESGFRYTPTTCFETFPFPWPLGEERAALDELAREEASRAEAEALAAHIYFAKEDAPPPVARTILDHVRAISHAAGGLDAMRRNWLGDRGEKARTLTALYNARPEWLKTAHAALDRAVTAAYGWPPDITADEMLSRLLEINRIRPSASDR